MSNQVFTTIGWCGVLSDGHVALLARGIEQHGRDVAEKVELEWMVPLLVEAEKDRPLSVTSQEGGYAVCLRAMWCGWNRNSLSFINLFNQAESLMKDEIAQ